MARSSTAVAASKPPIATADALPLVLRQEHLASLLDCHPRTVQRRQRAGQLPEPLDLDRPPRWSRDTGLRWLNGGVARKAQR